MKTITIEIPLGSNATTEDLMVWFEEAIEDRVSIIETPDFYLEVTNNTTFEEMGL